MRKCFVVTPIGAEGTEVRKRADQVFKHIISPVCQNCEFEPIRVDHVNQADHIDQTIIDMLNSAELVIADMTNHNPNAFYEMGYRACTGKPMIHIKQKDEKIPFDISGIRAFDYDLTDLDVVEEIKKRLEQTIKSFSFSDESNQENAVTSMVAEDSASTGSMSQILPILYTIQDQIVQLKDEIHKKDSETIQAIVKAVQPPIPVEDTNTTIMKAIIPELIKNPNSLKAIMEFSEKKKKSGYSSEPT